MTQIMATLLSRHIFEDIKKPEKSKEMYLMFLAKNMIANLKSNR